MTSPKFQNVRIPAMLILLAIISYAPVVNCGFIWDDDDYVTENHTLINPEGLYRIWFDTGATPQYYPLVHSSFWLEYQLWGLNPVGFHITNVILHAISGILVWLILKRIGIPFPWLPASVFIVHPVHVESVAWITERKNVLSGVFYLISMYCFFRATEISPSNQTSEEKSTSSFYRFYFLSIFAFIAALLSKTVVATLPAAIVLIILAKRKTDWKNLALKTIPFFLIGVPLGLLTAWLEKHQVGASDELFDWTIWERLFLASRAIWFYAIKILWPDPLIFFYPRWSLEVTNLGNLLALSSLLVFTFCLFIFRKRISNIPIAAWCFFMGTLFPALGFLNVYPMRFSYVADHFQYLASLGTILLLCMILYKVSDWSTKETIKRERVIQIFGGVWIAALMIVTWFRIPAFTNEQTLWLDTISKNKDAYAAYLNLGTLYNKQSRIDEALENFRIAETIEPETAEPKINIGEAYILKNQPDKAVPYLQQAIKLEPNLAKCYTKLGIAYTNLNQFQNAKTAFESAVELEPDSVVLRKNLILCLLTLKMEKEALTQIETALKVSPDDQSLFIDYIRILLMSQNTEVKNPKKALILAEALFQKGTDHPDIFELLTIAYLLNNQPQNATIVLQRGLVFAQQNKNQKVFERLMQLNKMMTQ